MSLFWIVLFVVMLFVAAFLIYGRFLAKSFDLEPERKTPAHDHNDGIDYVPTRKTLLLAQHFSAIAAAGPVVGPILAGLWFGWLPVLLWIVIGSIFFGAVHDFSSLAGSVRHGASSIVEMVKVYLGRRGYVCFLIFVWLSLIYVITAFTDLTSNSFVDPELGGGVATSSILYLGLGILLGLCLYRFKMPLSAAAAVFLPLVALSIWIGPRIPTVLPAIAGLSPQQGWNIILLLYCAVASVIPVWMLLQPRGFLGGFFLYITLAMAMVGLFLGGETAQYPAFIGMVNPKGLPLFPILFVTVACGACSGFHGIVCSGTTSKQINKETDCHTVGYGAMLLEGLVAVGALATVMILAKNDPLTAASPDRIYAEGLSRFVQQFGVPRDFARSFVLLAFTTFIYDTLDVATRLARHILEELTGWKNHLGRVAATLISLAGPLICVSVKITDAQGNLIPAWKVFWTIFGTSNQLLAALTLMILTLWLMRSKKPWWISGIPMIFMLIMTLWSLLLMIKPALIKLFSAGHTIDVPGFIALVLFVLSVLLMIEAGLAVKKNRASAAS